MKIKYITCSGANEFTDIDGMFNLYQQFPKIEFGIQVSQRKCYENSPRFQWLQILRSEIFARKVSLPLALHLNQSWVEGFCFNEIPYELEELLSYCSFDDAPIFKRIQLNFKIGRDKTPQLELLEKMISNFPYLRFILSYNENNADFIQQIYQRKRVEFDCLFDESFGEGVLPENRKAPAFDDILQGYAGGISPQNVTDELSKIAQNVPEDASVFIDAEGQLKGGNGHLSLDLCKEYVSKACAFEYHNRKET